MMLLSIRNGEPICQPIFLDGASVVLIRSGFYFGVYRYSIIRRSLPFIIPGGRFRESYYWDSYWIVLGLLACDMEVTAQGLVRNLLDDVSTYGFVPNGGRIYYLNRSQPPLLSDMVVALVKHNPRIGKI